MDVVVVGGGIVGAACARECAQAGLRTAVIETRWPGGGATAAGMGHVVVMDDSPAQLALTRLSRQLWAELAPALPPSAEYEATGTLWVATDEEELSEAYAKHALYQAEGIATEMLDAAQLATAEPRLRAGLPGALLVPQDCVVYPPAAAQFFLSSPQRGAIVVLCGQSVVELQPSAVRLGDGTLIHAGHIILATGADCSLLPGLPVKKRKGHLLITDRHPGFVRHQLVELGYLKSAHTLSGDSVAFNIQPRQTGQLLIGSSRQYGQQEVSVEAGMMSRMLDRAIHYIPTLAQVSGIRAWTGFRAATPDKLPLIGSAEAFGGHSSLLLAMGFEGLGITNATGAARLLVDALLGRTSLIDPLPYHPARSFASTSMQELPHA